MLHYVRAALVQPGHPPVGQPEYADGPIPEIVASMIAKKVSGTRRIFAID
jgi:hypothetical protein